MATSTVWFTPLCTAAASDKTQILDTPKRFVSCLGKLPSPIIRFSNAKPFRSSNFPRDEFGVNDSALGVLGDEYEVIAGEEESNFENDNFSSESGEKGLGVNKSALGVLDDEYEVIAGEEASNFENDNVSSEYGEKGSRHCQVYVCNLPRRYDVAALFEKFKPFGTVISVEVSRNASGESKGCGYVTMESLSSARDAIAALDGSDVDGREMRARFSAEMNYGKSNPEARNSPVQKVFIYEGPYKVYVGNLARTVRPEFLRNEFSKFGTVSSVRVFHESRAGRWYIYGFVSFHSAKERDAALVLNGMIFHDRNLVVKEGNKKN